jgi:type VI secretion system secreted protein Hcp
MAVDMFIKIDGIIGDSRDHKHKGEIELLSFSWGLANQTSNTGGGGGSGKPVVQDFSIVKEMSSSSPALMEKCCTGEHISSATITLVNKETKEEFYKIKLTDVLISSYQTGGSGGGGAVPMDQVSFNFSSVDLQAADRKGNFNSVSCDFHKLGNSLVQHDH